MDPGPHEATSQVLGAHDGYPKTLRSARPFLRSSHGGPVKDFAKQLCCKGPLQVFRLMPAGRPSKPVAGLRRPSPNANACGVAFNIQGRLVALRPRVPVPTGRRSHPWLVRRRSSPNASACGAVFKIRDWVPVGLLAP